MGSSRKVGDSIQVPSCDCNNAWRDTWRSSSNIKAESRHITLTVECVKSNSIQSVVECWQLVHSIHCRHKGAGRQLATTPSTLAASLSDLLSQLDVLLAALPRAYNACLPILSLIFKTPCILHALLQSLSLTVRHFLALCPFQFICTLYLQSKS